jgi:hypothetical protein
MSHPRTGHGRATETPYFSGRVPAYRASDCWRSPTLALIDQDVVDRGARCKPHDNRVPSYFEGAEAISRSKCSGGIGTHFGPSRDDSCRRAQTGPSETFVVPFRDRIRSTHHDPRPLLGRPGMATIPFEVVEVGATGAFGRRRDPGVDIRLRFRPGAFPCRHLHRRWSLIAPRFIRRPDRVADAVAVERSEGSSADRSPGKGCPCPGGSLGFCAGACT